MLASKESIAPAAPRLRASQSTSTTTAAGTVIDRLEVTSAAQRVCSGSFLSRAAKTTLVSQTSVALSSILFSDIAEDQLFVS